MLFADRAMSVSEAEIAARVEKLQRLREAIGRAVIGQDLAVEQLLISLIAGGIA